MSGSDPRTSTKDERVNGIIAEYLRCVERGDVPDRAALLARHAELATELSAFFADHDQFRRAAVPLADAASRTGVTVWDAAPRPASEILSQ